MPGNATALIVPIDVRALTVGQPDSVQSPALGHLPVADFSLLQTVGPLTPPYIGPTALATASPFQGEAALPAGIHIQWALPSLLTKGVGTSGITFPTVPNRWLVTRILQDTSQTVPCQTMSWVVESDRLSPTPDPNLPAGLHQPTVPLAPSAPQSYQYIGARFPLAGWSEDSTASRLAPLTAVGYGEQTFASYYPNCSTVFGFLDDFSDNPTWNPNSSTLTYQVTGWYSNPADDPLNPSTLNSVPVASGWAFTGTPTSTLCSGFVGQIAYNPTTSYISNPQPNPMTVAVAPSQAEAVSAILASSLSGVPQAEQVLNALQFGLLTAQGTVDAVEEFEEDVHAAGFGSQPGGTLWSIVANTDQSNQSADQSEATLPVALADLLNTLNTAQFALDTANRDLQARQWGLFQDWFKLQVVAYSQSPPPGISQQALETLIQNEAAAIGEAQSEISTTLLSNLSAAQTAVETALALVPSLGFSLTSSAAPQGYTTPHDPILLLHGTDVDVSPRYGDDGAGYPNGLLPCRLTTDVVSSMSLAAGLITNSSAVTVSASSLPPVGSTTALPAGGPWQALMQEPVLLSAALIPTLIYDVLSTGGADNPATLDSQQTQRLILQAQANLVAQGNQPVTGISFAGTAPVARGIVDGGTVPWLPLRLEYNLTYVPVATLDVSQQCPPYPSTLITSNFELSEGSVDFTYTGSPLDQSTGQSSFGATLLTPFATNDLNAEIQAYVANNAGSPLDPSLSALVTFPQLAQSAGGFTSGLLMTQQNLQLPIADPGGSVTPAVVTAVAQAAGVQAMYNPMPELDFNPVRAGQLSITALRVVDVFGRYMDYPAANLTLTVAQSMQPPTGWPAGSAYLAPRIAQPCRLLCDWVSAEDQEIETNSHPATSPIIGFVVPNYLDSSLLLYSNSGTAIVTLQVFGSGAVTVVPAPGSGFNPGATIAQIFAGQNADLQNFVSALVANGATSFTSFFGAVQSALEVSLPAAFRQSSSLASLCGQPLALARAAITLDVAGPPALDASWYGLQEALAGKPVGCLWNGVAFPILLGDQAQLNDTLVGFFLEPGGQTDYSTFYSPYVAQASTGVAPQTQDTLTLTPTQEATVIALLDPRGTVHVASGIVPMQTMSIPPDQWSASLDGLSVSFIARPLLSGASIPQWAATSAANVPSLTLPSAASGSSWSWAALAQSQWNLQSMAAPATSTATFSYAPQAALNGWLVLNGAMTSGGGTGAVSATPTHSVNNAQTPGEKRKA